MSVLCTLGPILYGTYCRRSAVLVGRLNVRRAIRKHQRKLKPKQAMADAQSGALQISDEI